MEFINEIGAGRSALQDGVDAQSAGSTNGTNIPVEILEAEHPIAVEQFAILPDSEGAGKHRGGMGLVREHRYRMDETQVQVRADRAKQAPYGLFGGRDGGRTHISLCVSGVTTPMPSKFITVLNPGDGLRVEMPGGDGWGDPLERAPELVLEDVRAEKVSAQRAREVDGVVVDPQMKVVDYGATERLRRRLRQQQLS